MTTYIATYTTTTKTAARKLARAAKIASQEAGMDIWTERAEVRSQVAFAVSGSWAADREALEWAQACVAGALAEVGL